MGLRGPWGWAVQDPAHRPRKSQGASRDRDQDDDDAGSLLDMPACLGQGHPDDEGKQLAEQEWGAGPTSLTPPASRHLGQSNREEGEDEDLQADRWCIRDLRWPANPEAEHADQVEDRVPEEHQALEAGDDSKCHEGSGRDGHATRVANSTQDAHGTTLGSHQPGRRAPPWLAVRPRWSPRVAYVRGLLVVNPRATTTSPRVTDVLVQAFAKDVELEVVMTTHRGHAISLGEQARQRGLDLVITLGGDGVVNEVVNGMLVEGPGPDVPMLATVPGGSGNVFARALGLPPHAVRATGQLLDAIQMRRFRTIGLGIANGRYFAANAGLGIDAEVIAAMEHQRRSGHHATPLRYLATTTRALLSARQEHAPTLVLQRPGSPAEEVCFAFIQNTSPWTYFGALAIDPCPAASFDTGLDVFALRHLDPISTARAVSRMVIRRQAGSSGRSIVLWHDQSAFTLYSPEPVAMQIDGEGIGGVRHAEFAAVPQALRVLC